MSVALSVWEGKETWTGAESGVRFGRRLLWWWRQKKEHVGILFSSKVIFKVLSCSFSGLSASQVWALNLILEFNFLNLPLEDAVGTDTVGAGMLHCQLWKRWNHQAVVIQRTQTVPPHKKSVFSCTASANGGCASLISAPVLPWWEQEAP